MKDYKLYEDIARAVSKYTPFSPDIIYLNIRRCDYSVDAVIKACQVAVKNNVSLSRAIELEYGRREVYDPCVCHARSQVPGPEHKEDCHLFDIPGT